MYDRGNEFPGHAFKNDLIKNEFGIKAKFATTENSQANSVLEQIHQFIANLVRTYDLKNIYLDEDDPWSGILVATYFWYKARTILCYKTLQDSWYLDVT